MSPHSILLLLFLYLGSASAAAFKYPIGISVGPRFLTSAYIGPEGENVLVAIVPGNDDYVEFVRHEFLSRSQSICRNCKPPNVSHTPGNRQPTEKQRLAVSKAIQDIHAATESKLGQTINVRTFAIPQSFRLNAGLLVGETAMKLFPSMKAWTQVQRYVSMAVQAHRFNTPDGLKIDFDEFHQSCNHILFLNINEEALEVYLADVSDEGQLILDQMVLSNQERGALARDHELWAESIENQLRNFTLSNFKQHDILPRSFRAVALGGEADHSVRTKIKDIMSEVIKGWSNATIEDAIDGEYVAAVGAARFAKWQVDEPYLFTDIRDAEREERRDEL